MPAPDPPRPDFDAWLLVQRPRLVAKAAAILGDSHEAEDIVQETLTLLWQRRQTAPPTHLPAYAARAVELNALKRRARRRRHLPLDAVAEQPAPLAADELSLSVAELEAAVAGLPLSQQTVLRLKFFVGLTFQQIAASLAISQNTAASRYRYALATLRDRLRPRPRP